MTLQLLFRDRHYVGVHKPAGLLMHRSPISRDETFLLQRLRDQIGQRVYPVHRLDRATSGVVVFGLDPQAAGRLGEAFMARTVRKEYLALARGWVDESGIIDHPVRDREGNGDAQEARTAYRRLARVELDAPVDRYPTSRYSLVEVLPETGRRHQIRKHFKHISHHLVGDTSYGNGRHNRYFRTSYGIHRLMLTATRLVFAHPYSGETLDLRAAPEADWQRLQQAFGWSGLREP